MNIVDYMKNRESLVSINEDKTAVAIFQPTTEGYALRTVYDTKEHEFGIPEFIDIEYQKRFPNQPLEKQYFKRKK